MSIVGISRSDGRGPRGVAQWCGGAICRGRGAGREWVGGECRGVGRVCMSRDCRASLRGVSRKGERVVAWGRVESR